MAEMKKTTKADLANGLTSELGLTKAQAEGAVKYIVESIVTEVTAGNEVYLFGLGGFTRTDRAARIGINPATKEKLKIAASHGIKFKASKSFKETVKASK